MGGMGGTAGARERRSAEPRDGDEDAVANLFREPQGNTAGGEAKEQKKQLYWFDLKTFTTKSSYKKGGGTELVPDFLQKPIHGDLAYQEAYHHSFFHPEKDVLLGTKGYSIVDKFRHKTGAYAIPGVQRKLNLLLFGPPGTGKSKLIRTLAMYTQRHVVSVQLAKIKTHAQLMLVMENLKMIPTGESTDENSYDDFIFVLEEIDTDKRGICLDRTADGDRADGDGEKRDGGDENQQENCGAVTPREAVARAELDTGDESETSARKMSKRQAKKKEGEGGGGGAVNDESDPLTLGMLLTILDGGSETPGRMVVMTTNQEDKLDAAFKRPGRVKSVRLDHLSFEEFKVHRKCCLCVSRLSFSTPFNRNSPSSLFISCPLTGHDPVLPQPRERGLGTHGHGRAADIGAVERAGGGAGPRAHARLQGYAGAARGGS